MKIFFSITILCAFIIHATTTAAGVPNSDIVNNKNLVDIKTQIKDAVIDLKYATPDNFAKKVLYQDLKQCFVLKDTAAMLLKADAELKKINKHMQLHFFDCLRPRSVQIKMWDIVKGTPSEAYVANPHTKTSSIHNYGCAVDISLSENGKPIDMGTPYDYFAEAAHPKFEIQQMGDGHLSVEQISNRVLLRYVMTKAGFRPISNEWWHFNCASDQVAREKYKLID
jgi:zinc D-Ala-D-Ala dipeptidase